MKDITETMSFVSEDFKKDNIKHVLRLVNVALEERGYNAVNQISGFIVSNDPAYISSHNNARSVIQSVDRYELIEELVRFYLNSIKEDE